MKVEHINGEDYQLPDGLNEFQFQLYVHLINWKWANITHEPGYYNYQGQSIPYDAILPAKMVDDLRVIYPPVADELRQHRNRNHFRLHTHFHHMASSQAANVNLFLPILRHPRGHNVLALLKPDFAALATDQLDQGYCLEFWGGNFGNDKFDRGPLGDKSKRGGTDSDIAIAYRNHTEELCLWLIEHKLAEKEFTPCGGYKSKGRKDHPSCDCTLSFERILNDKNACYHHAVLGRQYWNITEKSGNLFAGHASYATCPMKGDMNQLWRNQLLAETFVQQANPFKHAHFSVVRHPQNTALVASLKAYKNLIGNNPKFTAFTSEDVVLAAESLNDEVINLWAKWYRDVYMLSPQTPIGHAK